MATRRDVTDSPSEQGLEVGPSGLGSPLNVRTRKHPVREVQTSGCGPVRCRRGSPRNGPAILPHFGVGNRLPTLRGRTRRASGRARHEVRLVPRRSPTGGRTGFGPQLPSAAPLGVYAAPALEHDDVGVSRLAGEIGASSTGPSGTCMRPFAGSRVATLRSRVDGTSAVPALYERAGPGRRSPDRRMQAGPEWTTARRQRPR